MSEHTLEHMDHRVGPRSRGNALIPNASLIAVEAGEDQEWVGSPGAFRSAPSSGFSPA